jgi:hypothetical protein
MTYDPAKRAACRKRYYDTHREQCRAAILALRCPVMHRYDNP